MCVCSVRSETAARRCGGSRGRPGAEGSRAARSAPGFQSQHERAVLPLAASRVVSLLRVIRLSTVQQIRHMISPASCPATRSCRPRRSSRRPRIAGADCTRRRRSTTSRRSSARRWPGTALSCFIACAPFEATSWHYLGAIPGVHRASSNCATSGARGMPCRRTSSLACSSCSRRAAGVAACREGERRVLEAAAASALTPTST